MQKSELCINKEMIYNSDFCIQSKLKTALLLISISDQLLFQFLVPS